MTPKEQQEILAFARATRNRSHQLCERDEWAEAADPKRQRSLFVETRIQMEHAQALRSHKT